MAKHRHVLLHDTESLERYVSTSSGGRKSFRTPVRDRVPHARKLKTEIDAARQAIEEQAGHAIEDICLECFSDPDHPLKLESLEDRRSGIELLSVRREDNRTYATIFVPLDKLPSFVKRIHRYETETDSRRKDAGPKNKDLVESIAGVRVPIVRSFFTDRLDKFPDNEQAVWWEVWLRLPPGQNPDEHFAAFVAEGAQFQLSEQVVRFPERLVFLAFASPKQWAEALPLLLQVAELRRAKEIPTEFLELKPSEQAEFVQDGAQRIQPPPADAPAVCLLDTGANRGHPLLAPLLHPDDVLVVHPTWSAADQEGHGTQMAGIAAFGDGLANYLHATERLAFAHRLESMKILHPSQPHDPDNYGYVTTEAVAIAEIRHPQRNRVACLAVTADDRDRGLPSLWSAAIDQHSAGALDDARRLYVVAAGNVRTVTTDPAYRYPMDNRETFGVEDPGQSWNALTVGAYTDLAHIRSPEFHGYQPVAPRGGLCPSSRTSLMWDARDWPLKPDVVMEGGNYARSPDDAVHFCDDLTLLTTTTTPTGRLLDCMTDSSAASAQAARFAAMLMADYPDLWPETVRGLIVHSADWTPRMLEEFPDINKNTVHRRLRCYGYGVPDFERALWTLNNQVSLIYQGQLQPFELDGSDDKTRDFHLHDLPWPKDVLESLGEQPATVRITLSYFIEPSPGRRGWNKRFRYASHGLRFALRGPTETDDDFRRRITRDAWEEDEGRPSTAEPQDKWALGPHLRTRGSLHSDSWTSTAADIASCGQVAVYPVTGWWRERKHLGRIDRAARYALIITVSTPDKRVDLYTPIAQQVGIVTEVEP